MNELIDSPQQMSDLADPTDILAPVDDAVPDEPSVPPLDESTSPDDLLSEEEVVLDLSKEGSIALAHSQLKDYIHRGDLMRDVCLYWYVATTERITFKSEESRLKSRKNPDSKTSAGPKSTPRSPFLASHPHFKTHPI